LPALFRSATAVAFPSLVDSGGDREGFGLVAVEAMGCGCAVVGSDLPAMRDFLRHEETGLVVEAGSESDLAQALIRLLDDPGLRRELGAAGRTLVESRYDWDAVADNYATLLHATQIGTHPDGGESP
jgi:glycosyltransferase involved in cell wall biosynthesis